MEENENLTQEQAAEAQNQDDAFLDGWDDEPTAGAADQQGAEDDDEASEPSRAAG